MGCLEGGGIIGGIAPQSTKREVKLTIKGSFLSCFSDLYKGNKILSNSQEKEPADYLTE